MLGIALLLAGIGFAVVGLNRPEPTCGTQVMKPGDDCVVGNKAVSYAESKGRIDEKAGTALGIGLGLGVAGALLVVVSATRRRRAASGPPTPSE